MLRRADADRHVSGYRLKAAFVLPAGQRENSRRRLPSLRSWFCARWSEQRDLRARVDPDDANDSADHDDTRDTDTSYAATGGLPRQHAAELARL